MEWFSLHLYKMLNNVAKNVNIGILVICHGILYRLPSSSDAPSVVTGGSFFSWGSKFRYSGRVEREILEDTGLKREEPTITRGSIRRKASSVPATPSTPIASDLGNIKFFLLIELLRAFYTMKN